MNHGNLDLLSIGHFLLYFLIGLYWKHKYAAILVVSIIWELFEKIIVSYEFTRSLVEDYWFIPIRYIDDTLDHSITDIVINMIGYTIGSSLR